MLISLTLAKLAAGAASTAGTRRVLQIQRSENEGPFYPHIVEREESGFIRFFAGRIVGITPSAELPLNHPVANDVADDWRFSDNEPDGSWIAAKFDTETGILSVAADAFNLQRWFYFESDEAWHVSNSLPHLQRIAGGVPIEENAVPYMLKWGYLPCHITPLRNARELDAGEVLTIREGRGTVSRRTHLPVHRRAVVENRNHPVEIAEALRTAVRQELQGLSSVILPLSGGIDSRFLLGCAVEVLEPEQITTMTFGRPHSWDARIGTAVARTIGVRNLRLEHDTRPIGELLRDNFSTSEGMYWTAPDYPVTAYKSALPQNCCALSGFIGDPVFGSKEKGIDFETNATGKDDELLRLFHESAQQVSWNAIQPLLNTSEQDPLSLDVRFSDLPGATKQEKFDFWYFGPHTTNRTHYAVAPARHRAFFLAPFIHRHVLDVAFSMPPAERRHRRAYFAALKSAYPHLYALPTTNNHGFPLSCRPGLSIHFSRAWRRLWAELNSAASRVTGDILYQHPRYAYYHPHELLRSIHRSHILDCFENLKTLSVFNSKGMDVLIARMRKRSYMDPWLLRGLLTVNEWLLHYRT